MSRYLAVLATLVVACVSSSENENGTNNVGGSGGDVPAPKHGLPSDAKVSALTKDQRLTLCADIVRRIDENMGAPEQECTTMFIQTRKDTSTDTAQCDASVQKCVNSGLPKHADDAERIRLCDNTIPPLIGSNCQSTVADYDACLSEKLAAHTKNLKAVACKDPTTWKRLKSDVAPACNRLVGPSCMIFNPSSF
jgi:hypothetical protein